MCPSNGERPQQCCRGAPKQLGASPCPYGQPALAGPAVKLWLSRGFVGLLGDSCVHSLFGRMRLFLHYSRVLFPQTALQLSSAGVDFSFVFLCLSKEMGGDEGQRGTGSCAPAVLWRPAGSSLLVPKGALVLPSQSDPADEVTPNQTHAFEGAQKCTRE